MAHVGGAGQRRIGDRDRLVPGFEVTQESEIDRVDDRDAVAAGVGHEGGLAVLAEGELMRAGADRHPAHQLAGAQVDHRHLGFAVERHPSDPASWV